MSKIYPCIIINDAKLSPYPDNTKHLYLTQDEELTDFGAQVFDADGKPLDVGDIVYEPQISTATPGDYKIEATIRGIDDYEPLIISLHVLPEGEIKPPPDCRNTILPRLVLPEEMEFTFKERKVAPTSVEWVYRVLDGGTPDQVRLLGPNGLWSDDITTKPERLPTKVGSSIITVNTGYDIDFMYRYVVYSYIGDLLKDRQQERCYAKSDEYLNDPDGIRSLNCTDDHCLDTIMFHFNNPDIAPLKVNTTGENKFAMHSTELDIDKPYSYVKLYLGEDFDPGRYFCDTIRINLDKITYRLESNGVNLELTPEGIPYICVEPNTKIDQKVIQIAMSNGKYVPDEYVEINPKDDVVEELGIYDFRVMRRSISDGKVVEKYPLKVCFGSVACNTYRYPSQQYHDCSDPLLTEEERRLGQDFYGQHDTTRRFLVCAHKEKAAPVVAPSDVPWILRYETAMIATVPVPIDTAVKETYYFLKKVSSLIINGAADEYIDLLNRMQQIESIYTKELMYRGHDKLFMSGDHKYHLSIWYADFLDIIIYSIPVSNRGNAMTHFNFDHIFAKAPAIFKNNLIKLYEHF